MKVRPFQPGDEQRLIRLITLLMWICHMIN